MYFTCAFYPLHFQAHVLLLSYVCACLYVYSTHVGVSMHMGSQGCRGLRLMLKSIFHCSPTLSNGVVSPSLTQDPAMWLVLQGSILWGSLVSISPRWNYRQTTTPAGHRHEFCGSELWSSQFHGKCRIPELSPVPYMRIFNEHHQCLSSWCQE